MEIRKAETKDLDRIMEIYELARRFMAESGNPHQWGDNNWPPRDLIEKNIGEGKLYACVETGLMDCEEDSVHGVFYYDFGDDIDATFRTIEEGAWLNDEPYGVVHRIASDGRVKGMGKYCIDWAVKESGNLRIDTHGDNKVMQNLLGKMGFVRCGIIHVPQDNYPRIAFQKVL